MKIKVLGCVGLWVCEQSEEERELTQIQYLAWPDHGVPDDSTDFLDFVSLVRTKRAGQDQPMVVHCRYSEVNLSNVLLDAT